MNQFGGSWTDIKIEILVEYAKAYLTIMYKNPYWRHMYYDGFAGTGFIVKDNSIDPSITIGAARRIIEIERPMAFHEYYFVEKDAEKVKELEKNTKLAYPKKLIHVTSADCNKKLYDLSKFLRTERGKKYKILAYIDPCGMQVEWNSIEVLRNLPVDMWVLVPTGLGVNRLLKTNGQISEAWLKRLELFLGMDRHTIEDFFYTKTPGLFEEHILIKGGDAIKKSAELYKKRLAEVFKYVSKAYELRNKSNSVMYHLYLASNNNAAVKIANDIVRKYNSI